MDPIFNKVTIRGAFILNDRDKVKESKGQSGVKIFDTRINEHIIPTKTYPIELSVRAQQIAAEIIYGHIDEDCFYNLGIWDFKIISESSVGKAMLKLFARDVNQLILNAPRVLNAIYSGLSLKTEVFENQNAIATVEPNPYPPRFFEGIFFAAIATFYDEPKIIVNMEPMEKTIYKIRW